MPVPLLPAALMALRTIGPMVGRAGLQAARAAMANPDTRRITWSAARQAFQGDRRNNGPTTPPPSPSANTQAAREFYGQAARHYGTPRPSGTQLMQFAKDQSKQQEPDQAGPSLKRLAVTTVGLTAAFASLRMMTRDYGATIKERAEAFQRLNPTIAAAAAVSRREDLLRQFRSAEQEAPSTKGLLEARTFRDNAAQPFGSEIQRSMNILATTLTNLQGAALLLLDKVGIDDALQAVNDKLAELTDAERKKAAGPQQDFRQWLRDTAAGRYPKSPTPEELAGGAGRRDRRGR